MRDGQRNGHRRQLQGMGRNSMIKKAKINELQAEHKCTNAKYEYHKRSFVSRGEASQCVVNIYHIPPMKSAYPYHYHCKNEETFYIISGSGTLKTPEGEMAVEAGDLLFFPAGAGGAHKLTNTSPAEMLTYIDFDTNNDIEAVIYPDSNKIGIWGSGTNKVFQMDDEVSYYDGE